MRDRGPPSWYLPEGWRHLAPPAYRFIRLGRRDDRTRQPEIAKRRAELVALGWRDAPPGTRTTKWVHDGDLGVYLYIDEPTARQHEIDARQREHDRRALARSRGGC